MTVHIATDLRVRIACLAAALLLATVACLALGAQSAQAYEQHETASYKSGTHHVILMKNRGDISGEINEIVIYDPLSENQITAVKNSNSKVVRVTKSDDGTSITVKLKKAGKATVRYKYKGKAYKHKYVVQKYKNPVKTLKFGSKNYASKFKKYVYYGTNKHVDGVKLTVKPAKGWKVKAIQIEGPFPTKSVKSGYKLKKDDNMIAVILKDKKTGAEQYISIANSPNS